MKKLLFLTSLTILVILEVNDVFAQDFDLIVNLKGNSIARRINSMPGTDLCFEMKNNENRENTNPCLEEVTFYDYKSIRPVDYRIETGSSIINSTYDNAPRKNSVYIGIGTLTYSRILVSNPVGIALAAGFLYVDAPGVWVESSLLFGKSKHYFEPGINLFYLFNTEPTPEEDNSVRGLGLRFGYRYQAPGGFLFRVAPNILFSEDEEAVLVPAVSLGYSF
jgi:hypothetical protein